MASEYRTPKPWAAIALFSSITLIALALAAAAYFITADDSPKSEAKPAAPTPTVVLEDGGKNIKGNTPRGTVEENQKKLLLQTQQLLTDSYLLNKSFNEQQKAIIAGDLSALSPSYLSQYRFESLFANDEELQRISYVITAQLAKTIRESTGSSQITPLYADAASNIYVDLEAGVAHVPFGLFAGEQASFSLEWTFANGKWYFSPYTLIDAFQASATAPEAFSQ